MTNLLSRVTWEGAAFSVLMLWSFVTTGIGLSTLISGLEPPLGYGLAFLASAFVQLAIGTLWRSVSRAASRRALIGACVYGVFGLAVSVLSGTFASSANVWIYNSAFVQDVAAREDRKPILLPVVAVTEQATRLSAQMDAFSEFASARAERETNYGDSCEGRKLKAVCGRICKLRKKQAAAARDLAGGARGLRQDAIALRAQAGGQTSQVEINQLFKRASRIANDPRRGEMRSWVSRQLKGFESGFVNGKDTIVCRDSGAVSRLSTMLALLEDTTDLPTTPPTVREPTVMHVAARNMELLQQVLLGALDGVEGLAEQLRLPDVQGYLWFWLLSLGIEFGCAALAMRAGVVSNDWRGADRRLVSERDLGRLGSKTIPRTAEVLRMVRSLTIWQGRERFFLIPVDGRPELTEEAENLAHILELKPPRLRQALDADLIAPEEAERLKAATGAEYFRVWLVPQGDRFERRLARKLGVKEVSLDGSREDPNPGTGPRPALVFSR